jgi:hypothetical protein
VRLGDNIERHVSQRQYCDDKVTNYEGSTMRNRLTTAREELPRRLCDVGNQLWFKQMAMIALSDCKLAETDFNLISPVRMESYDFGSH